MTGLLCKNPRIVLILGTGYLGKALAESLRKAGHTALTADIDPQKAIYEADVADQASMQGLAARIPSPQIIVMCASTRGGLPQPLRSWNAEHAGSLFRNAGHLLFQHSRLWNHGRTLDYGGTQRLSLLWKKRAAYSGGTGGFGSGGHGRPAGSPVRAGPLCSRLPVRHEGEGPPRSHEQMAQLHPPG